MYLLGSFRHHFFRGEATRLSERYATGPLADPEGNTRSGIAEAMAGAPGQPLREILSSTYFVQKSLSKLLSSDLPGGRGRGWCRVVRFPAALESDGSATL